MPITRRRQISTGMCASSEDWHDQWEQVQQEQKSKHRILRSEPTSETLARQRRQYRWRSLQIKTKREVWCGDGRFVYRRIEIWPRSTHNVRNLRSHVV